MNILVFPRTFIHESMRCQESTRETTRMWGVCSGTCKESSFKGLWLAEVLQNFAWNHALRVVFPPWEGLESHRAGNPAKLGKNYKIPLPWPTPEGGENCPPKKVKLLRKYNFCNFSVIFRGSDRRGEFVIFPHFSGISAPEASLAKGFNRSLVHTGVWRGFWNRPWTLKTQK